MIASALYIAALFLANIATPGASFVLTVNNALAFGRKVGYSVAVGLVTADVFLAIGALAGLSVVLINNPDAMIALGYMGGAWIAGSGLKMMLHKSTTHETNTKTAPPLLNVPKAFRLGLTTGFVNIQTILFLASIFASYSSPDLASSALLLATLAITSIIARCGIARIFTVGKIQSAYLAAKSQIQRVAGAALFALGMKMSVKAFLPVAATLIHRI